MNSNVRVLAWTTVLLTLTASDVSPASAADEGRTVTAGSPGSSGVATGPHTVPVAGIVLKWLRGDKNANYRRAEPLIRKAAAEGAEIICTTECFLDGYAIADKSIPLGVYRALGEPIPGGEYFAKLSALAKELDILLSLSEGRQCDRHSFVEPDAGSSLQKHGCADWPLILFSSTASSNWNTRPVRNTAGVESCVF